MENKVGLCLLSTFTRVAQAVLCLFIVLGAVAPGAWGQADVQGQWSTLSYTMPINPIHVALLHNGKILVVTGSGNCVPGHPGCPAGPPFGPSNGSGAVVLDTSTGTITGLTVPWDMFCTSMTQLSDGRMLINGGTLTYQFLGSPQSGIFDPANNTFIVQPNMAHGRWYPTLVLLSDGRVMTFSGLDDVTGATNTTVEIFTVGSGWSSPIAAGWTPPLYPRLHLLPNGNVFYSGSSPISYLFNVSSETWTPMASSNYGSRTYGSSVMLPLTPANGYDPKIMLLGGDNPSTATTELIDLGASSPTWSYGPDMSQPRIEMDAVMLPTGKILAIGGSASDEDATTASLNADLYDPTSNSFSSAGQNVYARLYHTTSLLLPDATVWLAGSNPARGTYEPHMEIYQPAYLFTRDASNNVILATRPSIASVPTNIAWGGQFVVSTPDAASISQVVLVKDGSSTHAFDMDQRLVGMNFTAGSGTLTVTAPPNANIAPPGYYMVFLINIAGVPSVASFVLLSSSTPGPTVTAITPNSGSVSGGTTVSITGTGFSPGATVKLGGTTATGVMVNSSTSITATTAAHAIGTVTLVVTNADGQSGMLANGYTYTSSNPAPTVTSVAPNTGPAGGGTTVTIVGTNFLVGATVSFGGTAATGVTVVSSTSITATTAARAAGTVNVVVTNTDGQNGTLTNGYTCTSTSPAPTVTSVVPNTGPAGTAVTITGTGFLVGATVSFGGTAATGVTVVSSTSITAISPTHEAEGGAVTVVVTNADSQSGMLANGYTYTSSNPAPGAMSVAPNTGPAGGGTMVTIAGTNFLAGATVSFGGTAATGVTVVSSTSITATTAARAAGTVNVVVTNADGQNGTLTNGYTYTSITPSLAVGVPLADSSSATVVAGQTASYTLSIEGSGMSGTASLSCTGAPMGATCSVPVSQPFSSTAPATFNVNVTTTSRSLGALPPPAFMPAAWLWMIAALGMVIQPGIRAPKWPTQRYLRLLPLTLLLFLASCGGGGSVGEPQPNPNGTPAGTYTLTVKASSGSATAATSLTLIVR